MLDVDVCIPSWATMTIPKNRGQKKTNALGTCGNLSQFANLVDTLQIGIEIWFSPVCIRPQLLN